MFIPWYVKAAIQKTVSLSPWHDEFNHWLQQLRGTHSESNMRKRLLQYARQISSHLDDSEKCGLVRKSIRHFMFGAGWDCAEPLLMYAAGIDTQTVVDVVWHLRPRHVELMTRLIGESQSDLSEMLGRSIRPIEPFTGRKKDLTGYLGSLGIDYRAPVDARSTGLQDGCVNMITSYATLEHIPANDIRRIITECERLLEPGGVLRFVIALGDHYSFFDSNINEFNFLRFSDATFRLLNSRVHYQNRLRSSDYLGIFKSSDMEILKYEEIRASNWESMLETIPLAPRFRRYTPEDLSVGTVIVLMQKKE